MQAPLQDLEELEKQAFRRFYDDGLLDLLLGLMMVGMSLGYYVQEWLDSEVAGLSAMLGVAVVLVATLKVSRTRLLDSRLGRFTPADRRRRKIRRTRLALLGSAALGVIAFALGAVGQSDGQSMASVEVLLPLLWFVNATVVLGITAYLLDVPRFALYGILFGLVGPLQIWPDVLWDVRVPPPLAFGLPAMPIIAIGLWRLMRFLRDYPVQRRQDAVGRPAG